jgi:hypothetical protein
MTSQKSGTLIPTFPQAQTEKEAQNIRFIGPSNADMRYQREPASEEENECNARTILTQPITKISRSIHFCQHVLPTRNALIHGLGAEYASSSDSWNFCGPIIAVKIPHQDRLPSVTEYWPVNSSQLVREQKRVTDAERKAGPDSRTEIKRHPGNLVLPFSNVVRYYPTHARVSQPLQRA